MFWNHMATENLGFTSLLEFIYRRSNSNHLYCAVLSVVKASMDGILEAVRGKPGGISMTLEHIRIVLDQLGCSTSIEDNNVFYKMGKSVLTSGICWVY